MRLACLDIAVLGSLNRHDTYDVKQDLYVIAWRTYDGSSMHDRLGKQVPTHV